MVEVLSECCIGLFFGHEIGAALRMQQRAIVTPSSVMLGRPAATEAGCTSVEWVLQGSMIGSSRVWQ